MPASVVSNHPKGWAHALIRPPLLIGAVLVAVVSRKPRRLRRLLRRLHAQPQLTAQLQDALRQAIVGIEKDIIVKLLGQPRIVMQMSYARPAELLDANTWYYPLDPRGQTALAIEFKGDVARGADFITLPKQREVLG